MPYLQKIRPPVAYVSLLFFAVLLQLTFSENNMFGDPDTAWHLATGDLILHLGHIPLHDTWSFTTDGEVWYNIAWLYDVFISWLYTLAGFRGLYLFTVCMFAISVTTMCSYALTRGANIFSLLIVFISVICSLKSVLLVRPNTFSVLFNVIFFIALDRYRLEKRVRYLLPLPLLMALWVNLHGGFLLAFIMMPIFGLEAFLRWDKTAFRHILLVFLACLLATILNPYGYEVFYAAYKTVHADFSSYIIEWQPADITKHIPILIFLMWMLLLGIPAKSPIALSDKLLAIMLLLFTLSSVRHVSALCLLALPYMMLTMTYYIDVYPWCRHLRSAHQQFITDTLRPKDRVMAAVFAIITLIGITIWTPQIAKLEFPKTTFPVEEAAFIEKNYPTTRFINHYNIGGYLTYLWQGRVKVFVDGRANSLYSDDLLDDYMVFMQSVGMGGKSQLIMKKYDIQGIIIPHQEKDAGMWQWNPMWKPVFSGNAATVYLRSDLVSKN